MIKRIGRFFHNIEEHIIIVLFSAMLLLLTVTVFTRYIFDYTPSWAEQVARIMFVYISYAGISLAARTGMHLRVSAITMIIPKKFVPFVVLFGDLVAAVTIFVIFTKLFVTTTTIFQRGQTFAALPFFPVWIMYAGGVLGLLGMTIRGIQGAIIPNVREIWGKKQNTAKNISDKG